MKKEKTNNAVKILHQRYVRDNLERKSSLESERINLNVAQTIYDLRQEAGLTQKELARLVGTTQSVISRLEDADYDGHSLSMLDRIAKALNKQLRILVADRDIKNKDYRMLSYVFHEVVRGLRKREGLKVDELAEKAGIDKNEIILLEQDTGYKPTPFILQKLSNFYGISQQKLAILAGIMKDIPEMVREQVASFATQSESFSRLTSEEKKTLDEFVKFLKV